MPFIFGPSASGACNNTVVLLQKHGTVPIRVLLAMSACLVKKSATVPSHRILRYVHGVLNVDEKKLITQFSRKLRDERFELN